MLYKTIDSQILSLVYTRLEIILRNHRHSDAKIKRNVFKQDNLGNVKKMMKQPEISRIKRQTFAYYYKTLVLLDSMGIAIEVWDYEGTMFGIVWFIVIYFDIDCQYICLDGLENKLFMNNQLSNTKSGEYISNQNIVKSQKMLNKVTNFHMKTEQVEKNEDDPRGSQNNRGDLRDTWRKPRMPYNKLPDAFQIKPKKKKANHELLDNIDRIVKYNQYKEIQKYLEPISHDVKSEEKPKDFTENNNPLATYQKYLKIKSKFTEQIQEKDLSVNKYKPLSIKQTSSAIKITDCITLQVLKRGHRTGTIKKMLHVPTLKLICIRQEPVNNKETRYALKEWFTFWQNKLNLEQSKRYINISGIVYNMPQGAISVITEYFQHGSLLNLLDTVITLPESVIREIFVEVFEHLGHFYDASENHFGGLSPSQIMITNEGKIKLGLGIYYQISTPNTNNIYNLKYIGKAKQNQFNTTQKDFMKFSNQKGLHNEIQKSLDIFKLGLMLLECAIGGLQKFQHSSIIYQSLKVIFTEEGQKALQKQNVCCLIHSQIYLLQTYSQVDQKSKRDKLQLNKIIFYFKLLKDRFSMSFINFLCSCLKLRHSKRTNFRELINHSFLKNETSKDTTTVLISLNDLIQINNDWNNEFIQSTQGERLDKFIGHVLHVLNNCRKEVISELLTNSKDRILNLSKYIGLNYYNLGQKLYRAMLEMTNGEKKDLTTSI